MKKAMNTIFFFMTVLLLALSGCARPELHSVEIKASSAGEEGYTESVQISLETGEVKHTASWQGSKEIQEQVNLSAEECKALKANLEKCRIQSWKDEYTQEQEATEFVWRVIAVYSDGSKKEIMGDGLSFPPREQWDVFWGSISPYWSSPFLDGY